MRAPLLAGLAALALAAAAPPAIAEVVSIEFRFTPFVGDPATMDQVHTVPGMVRMLVNRVPYAEQDIPATAASVRTGDREVEPSVVFPAHLCGPALRKGTNTFQIEFYPEDGEQIYRAQLRSVVVTGPATHHAKGKEGAAPEGSAALIDKDAKGWLTLERDFIADFAADLPWHHNPPIKSLNLKDLESLRALVRERLAAFEPDFARVYAMMEGKEGIDVAKVKEMKCLDAAYAAGVRMAAPDDHNIDFLLSGNPEVMIRAKDGLLYRPADPATINTITDPAMRSCLETAIAAAFPARFAVVRNAAGGWEIVY